jgi:hypothetical protein
LTNAQMAAHGIGLQIHIVNASSERDFEGAFTTLMQHRVGALLVATDAFFTSGAINSSRWQHAKGFPRCIPFVSSQRPEG